MRRVTCRTRTCRNNVRFVSNCPSRRAERAAVFFRSVARMERSAMRDSRGNNPAKAKAAIIGGLRFASVAVRWPRIREHRSMNFIDLSRELYHPTPAHPSHPPVVMGTRYDHPEVKVAGATRFSSKALHLSLSDHAGTHVEAQCHFIHAYDAAPIDAMP